LHTGAIDDISASWHLIQADRLRYVIMQFDENMFPQQHCQV